MYVVSHIYKFKYRDLHKNLIGRCINDVFNYQPYVYQNKINENYSNIYV